MTSIFLAFGAMRQELGIRMLSLVVRFILVRLINSFLIISLVSKVTTFYYLEENIPWGERERVYLD